MKRTVAGILVLAILAGCGKQAAVVKRIPTPEAKKEEVKQEAPVKKEEVKAEPVKVEPAPTPEPTRTPEPKITTVSTPEADVKKKETATVWAWRQTKSLWSKQTETRKVGEIMITGIAVVGLIIWAATPADTPLSPPNHIKNDGL